MRMPLIALIPAALLAGAACAQAADPATAAPPEAPAETQAAEELVEAKEKAPPPQVETANVGGTWNREAAGTRDTVTFTSDTGEELFSATCMAADTETGDRIVQIKAASVDDTVGAIDIFTSAGNARLPAAPDQAPGIASGMTEPVSRPTYVLASGAGDMRIVSGTRGIVFETDPMLKSMVRSCQPDHLAEFRAKLEAGEFSRPASDDDADNQDVAEADAEEEGETATNS